MQRGFWEQVAYIVGKYGSWLLQGAGTTMLIAITGTVIGLVIGLLVGVVRTIPLGAHDGGPARRTLLRIANALLAIYIEVFRGTPMMVQAMVVYFGVKQQLGVQLNPVGAGILIVSINTGAYMAEIVRGGIQAVDPGQTEAGKALGLSHWRIMRGAVLPQTIRNILPATGNEFVINIKDTSVLSVISVTELFFRGRDISNITYRYFEAFLVIAAVYFILTFATTRVLRLLERRLAGPEHFTLATSSTMPESILDSQGRPPGRPHGSAFLQQGGWGR